jgi:hypothetical protein
MGSISAIDSQLAPILAPAFALILSKAGMPLIVPGRVARSLRGHFGIRSFKTLLHAQGKPEKKRHEQFRNALDLAVETERRK